MHSFLIVRLVNLWQRLSTSFWFIPALMTLAAILLFFYLSQVDQEHPDLYFPLIGMLDPVSAEGGRVILSTIAGSTITVAATVFSITIVTLTLAANQFGPRLLKNFMRSKSYQIVLGSFIATFVYCLCVLSSIQPADNSEFIPHLSINVAVLLALTNVAILIYFIHHVATAIQAENVIRDVSNDLLQQIRSFFPADRKNAETRPNEKDRVSDADYILTSTKWGYIQAVEYGTLLDIAVNNDCLIEVLQRAGDYVSQDQKLVRVRARKKPDDKMHKRICGAFIIGSQRSPEQDVEFAIRQLVEVATRALSPGINDPYTALGCIDHLETALSLIVSRHFPAQEMQDDKGYLRVQLNSVDFRGIVAAALNQIRQNANGKAAVLIRMVEALNVIADNTDDQDYLAVLQMHVDMISRAGKESLSEKSDRDDLQRRVEEFNAD